MPTYFWNKSLACFDIFVLIFDAAVVSQNSKKLQSKMCSKSHEKDFFGKINGNKFRLFSFQMSPILLNLVKNYGFYPIREKFQLQTNTLYFIDIIRKSNPLRTYVIFCLQLISFLQLIQICIKTYTFHLLIIIP